MGIIQAFLNDNFQINDPYTAEILRLYFLIKAGIVNITYGEYEGMRERDIAYLTAVAEADAIASDLKSKERRFMLEH